MQIKIILLQSVKNIGKQWDTAHVNAGYLKNFLLPQNLAVPATRDVVALAAAEKAKKSSAKAVKIFDVSKFDGQTFEISAKASKNDKLFAAINEKKIATAIDKNVTAEMVKSNAPIKELGEFEIKLHSGDHNADITIKIIAA